MSLISCDEERCVIVSDSGWVFGAPLDTRFKVQVKPEAGR